MMMYDTSAMTAMTPTLLQHLSVSADDEEMLRQLLSDNDLNEDPLHSHVSLESIGANSPTGDALLEPLEIPKGGTLTGLDSSFKDAFLNIGESPFPSPIPRPSKLFAPITTNHPSPGLLQDPHRTPRNSLFSDALMSILPIPTPSPTASSVTAIQALQSAIWSTSSSDGLQRLNPNSIKHVMMAASSASSQVPPRNMTMSATKPVPPAPLAPPAPSVTARIMLPSPTPAVSIPSPLTPSSSMWIASSLLAPTPTAASTAAVTTPAGSHAQTALELSRKISGKRGKERKTSAKSTPQRQSAAAAAAALAMSLASEAAIKAELDLSPSKGSKGKKCVEAGCTRRAQSNSRCKAHGGGARCQYAGPGGCTRSSQGGGFCRAHGGGKRCEYPGCTRGQQRKGRCYVHGGIRKCQMDGCEKKDRGNGFCISHGGGKRCVVAGCARAVRRGKLCQHHEDLAATHPM
ncbi:hypothetical protein Poli38472_010464 [Pythium oligandrum]|uniref:WRKY19-like zinc finger domain-containing protein n=1 Tax=Pythium oligandrum TaxID=41045 RepID=A0A8K1C347_PYTOL|nr:hypothetical protein Poli38472_010464 [Pythium oligandrum]|eukprot:TMW55582.1 hypothetical protein Poli38472_010464 [Pythium oligandrum]